MPVGVALGLLLALRAGRPEPKRRAVDARGAPVRVLKVTPRAAVPRAVGYGVVEAAYEWELVAEVSGRVVKMNEDLRVGQVIERGATLLRIDPQDYKLTEKQRRASLQNVQAQIQQLELQRRSVQANLKIEKQSLALTERELARTRSLFASGSATQADVDSAQRSALTQRSAVQSLENQLRELPASMAGLRAQLQESKVSLEGAQLDVGRTEIVAPFDIRIRELSIQPRELVTAGQTLAVADGIAAAEVPAQLTLGALQSLLVESSTVGGRVRSEGVQTPSALGRQLRNLDIRAVIRIESGGSQASWAGEVTRIGTVNATTRTIGVVVTVGEPLDVVEGSPPPLLLSGMYAEVEFIGQRQGGCLAVPRGAIRAGNQVYVVSEGSRLERREVSIGLRQANFSCVVEGVADGDSVIITDVQPAVQGMLVLPLEDGTATESLLRDLSGEGDAK
ncbi:MAG: TolC family protein [Myxococcota bacterium]